MHMYIRGRAQKPASEPTQMFVALWLKWSFWGLNLLQSQEIVSAFPGVPSGELAASCGVAAAGPQ